MDDARDRYPTELRLSFSQGHAEQLPLEARCLTPLLLRTAVQTAPGLARRVLQEREVHVQAGVVRRRRPVPPGHRRHVHVHGLRRVEGRGVPRREVPLQGGHCELQRQVRALSGPRGAAMLHPAVDPPTKQPPHPPPPRSEAQMFESAGGQLGDSLQEVYLRGGRRKAGRSLERRSFGVWLQDSVLGRTVVCHRR